MAAQTRPRWVMVLSLPAWHLLQTPTGETCPHAASRWTLQADAPPEEHKSALMLITNHPWLWWITTGVLHPRQLQVPVSGSSLGANAPTCQPDIQTCLFPGPVPSLLTCPSKLLPNPLEQG